MFQRCQNFNDQFVANFLASGSVKYIIRKTLNAYIFLPTVQKLLYVVTVTYNQLVPKLFYDLP